MIPKIIHYCWFGEKPMSPLIQACILSWKKYLPDWEIKEWNELNSPIDHPFVKKALQDKKYAFAADYVRCYALYEYGGVYLDTDMEIIRDLSPLLIYDFFSAYEDSDKSKVSCGAIGSLKGNILMYKMLKYYDQNSTMYIAMPQILGKIYNDSKFSNFKILKSDSFYPYNPFDESKPVKQLMFNQIVDETYGIHHWGYSWKFSFFDRVINKIKKYYFSNEY